MIILSKSATSGLQPLDKGAIGALKNLKNKIPLVDLVLWLCRDEVALAKCKALVDLVKNLPTTETADVAAALAWVIRPPMQREILWLSGKTRM